MTNGGPKAPTTLESERLIYRAPVPDDAEAIFERYAGDPTVGRYLAWPIHRSITDTEDFLRAAAEEWHRSPSGAYLIFARDSGNLIGSTGLHYETAHRASTGYVLAEDSWGQGYATEALCAITRLADDLGVARLYALCHPDHVPSRRVLEKGGFTLEGTLHRYCEFPNLAAGEMLDVLCYAKL